MAKRFVGFTPTQTNVFLKKLGYEGLYRSSFCREVLGQFALNIRRPFGGVYSLSHLTGGTAMPDYDQQSLVAVLEQKLKDLERRVAGMENTSRVLLLLVLTTVIGTVLKTIGVG